MDWMTWCNSLSKPSWTPSPATIGLIWTILYPVIFVSFGLVFVQALRGKVTYFDKSLFVQPHAEELKKVMAIPSSVPSGSAVNAQYGGGSKGHSEARHGTEGVAEGDEGQGAEGVAQVPVREGFVTKRHDPASCDTGSFQKRVIGVEPTTFTLATS